MTTETSASNRPSWMASKMLCRLRPEPETKAAIFKCRILSLRESHKMAALFYLTDPVSCFATGLQFRQNQFRLFRRGKDHITDAHVEGSVHFMKSDIALLLQPLKYRQYRPSTQLKDRIAMFRQHPRHIFDKSTACNMHHPLDRQPIQQGEDGFDIDFCRC